MPGMDTPAHGRARANKFRVMKAVLVAAIVFLAPFTLLADLHSIEATLPDPEPALVGRIEIPRLDFAAVIREGCEEETLSRAVGRVPGTARPGQRGNMVLAGHRDTFFSPLREIAVNDRIRVVSATQTYEYKVEALRVVVPEEVSVMESRGVSELTLVTCYPFAYAGPAPYRLIVSATRVN